MEALSEILKIAQVVFGIGLVIFVHELGHYLAARMCGVRVETFSLGFGPRLFGFQKGPTVYQVAAVPLGGYCRMAGEDYRQAGRKPAPDELAAKPVGQRFFIYSGGVLMNVAFAMVVFPIIFYVGVPFTRPTIDVNKGGAAWAAGVPDKSEIVAIDGKPIHDFGDLFQEVALGDPDGVTLSVRERGVLALQEFFVVPNRNAREGLRVINVSGDCKRDEEGRPILHVSPDSSAAKAGLRNGDALIEVRGMAYEPDPKRQLELKTLRSSYLGMPLEVLVQDEEGKQREVRIEPEMVPIKGSRLVGIQGKANLVQKLRDSEDLRSLDLREGDELLRVNGRKISLDGDLMRVLAEAGSELEIEFRRKGQTRKASLESVSRERLLALVNDISLANNTTFIVPQASGPADKAGFMDGDRVTTIDGQATKDWSDIQRLVRKAGKEKREALFGLTRTGTDGEESLKIAVLPSERSVPVYGLGVSENQYLYRSSGFGEAMTFGMRSSWNILRQTWLTLRRMLFNDISPKNAGGIITIGKVSYHVADTGWTKLFFFLCLLSINLAVINVLPIPVLDGVHLAFLIVEKIKGTPVSRRTLEYSQMVGVVLLLTLMVYVTYNDLVRWVFPPQQ